MARRTCFVLGKLQSENENCPICLQKLCSNGHRVIVSKLPCGHSFHAHCAQSYQKSFKKDSYGDSRTLQCPYCRHQHLYLRDLHSNDDFGLFPISREFKIGYCIDPNTIRANSEAVYIFVLAQIKSFCIDHIPNPQTSPWIIELVHRTRIRRCIYSDVLKSPNEKAIAHIAKAQANDRDIIDIFK